MLLLEIGYSEKYDTFTGYVCNQSEYYRYEVDKDKVELIPIGQEFNSCTDFVDKISKSNPYARFLADPIEIKDVTYRELERYKRLALATVNSGNWIITKLNIKKLFIVIAMICLVAGVYSGGQKYYTRESHKDIVIPFQKTVETENIQYYYKIHLIRGGFVEGFDLEQNEKKVFVTNRKGLDITIDLSSIKFIERVELGNILARNVIYGSRGYSLPSP